MEWIRAFSYWVFTQELLMREKPKSRLCILHYALRKACGLWKLCFHSRGWVSKTSGTKDLVVVILCGWIQAAHRYRGRPGTRVLYVKRTNTSKNSDCLARCRMSHQLSFNASYVFHPIATANGFYEWFQPIFFW